MKFEMRERGIGKPTIDSSFAARLERARAAKARQQMLIDRMKGATAQSSAEDFDPRNPGNGPGCA